MARKNGERKWRTKMADKNGGQNDGQKWRTKSNKNFNKFIICHVFLKIKINILYDFMILPL